MKTLVKQRRKKSQKGTSLRFPLYFVGGFAILALILVIVALVRQAAEQPLSVELTDIETKVTTFEKLDSAHVLEGSPEATYNSNPPTSGPHFGTPAQLGVYTDHLPDEVLIHNLEHGLVWLSYRDADDQDAISMLTEMQRRNSNWVIVTHRPRNDARIAAASWTQLMNMDDLNKEQIQAFITTYRNKAPESVSG